MITKIHIGAFGRLRDFEIELKEGLNLIYGKNESGKSTLSAFIKAAFYGLPPTRVQNLADNDRKRFLPWGGQAMSGRLEVALPGGKAYLIEREFRGIPSKDALRVVEKGTGTKNAALLPVPGEALFGMGLSTFERTAFIGQDRHKINSSDEMIRKLSNMFSSASEEVSYKNATDLLSERKRFYLTARNTGKIGELKSRLLSLEDELSAVKRLKEDAALLFQERRAAEAEMERLESELRQAKERRAAGEVLARAADYEKLAALTQKIGDLELALRLEADKIGGGPLPADEGYLARLEEAYLKAVKAKSYLAPLVKGAEDRAARLAEMRREWDALPESLKRAGADQEVSALEKRIADLAGKAEAARKRSGELSLLRQQKERLAGMRNRGFEQVPADRVLEIMTREGRPRASSGGGVREGMFLGVGLLTLLLSVPLAAVWNRPPYALAAAAAGLGILAVFIRNFLMERKRKKREEADLEAVCALMGVPDAARLKEEYIKEQGLRKETESLEVRIGILEEAAKAGGDLSALETELGREKTRLEEILREADCGSAALFFEKTSRARGLAEHLAISGREQAELESGKEIETARAAALEKEAVALSAGVFPATGALEDVGVNIDLLRGALGRLREGRAVLSGLRQQYQAILGDRRPEELKEAFFKKQAMPGGAFPEPSGGAFSAAPGDAAERLAAAVAELKKKHAVLSERISGLFDGKPSIAGLMEEMETTRSQIREMEKRYQALDIALKVIGEGLDELQSQFSPELNKLAGENIYYITNGKYSQLLIDKNYEIRLYSPEDSLSHELSYFSTGTVDQVYLAVRLALLELLESGPDKAPLILDDTFAQFDDERLERVLETLLRLSRDRQIILMTCRGREAGAAGEKGRGNVLEIQAHKGLTIP